MNIIYGKSYKQKANVLNAFQRWGEVLLRKTDTAHPGKASPAQVIIIFQTRILENNYKIVIFIQICESQAWSYSEEVWESRERDAKMQAFLAAF